MMKIRIIKTVFLGLSVLTLVVGLVSFTHEDNRLNSTAIILASITYYLSYLSLAKQYPEGAKTGNLRNNMQLIGAIYIFAFFLYLMIALVSYTMEDSLTGLSSLVINGAIQFIGYRVFIMETDERPDESE